MNRGFVVWLTGLPASGKTTLAQRLRISLIIRGYSAMVLDGDELRKTLWPELGYSREERNENIRRIAHLAKMLYESGIVVIVAVISPYRSLREYARKLIGDFIEVYLSCPVEVCEKRDPKGMYEKAKSGEIPQFTGISDLYEPPVHPEVILKTDQFSPNQCLEQLLSYLQQNNHISSIPKALTLPHGGELVQQSYPMEGLGKISLENLPRISVEEEYLMDAENIASGAYSPLKGFLSVDEILEVLETHRLPNGLTFGIPVFLPVSRQEAMLVKGSSGKVLLTTKTASDVALLKDAVVEEFDAGKWVKRMFGTDNTKHPGVQRFLNMPGFVLSGQVFLLKPVDFPFRNWSHSPLTLREEFLKRGWKTAAAFQTRNPPHRGHEFTHRLALEKTDGLLIHPIVGAKREADFSTEIILQSYQLLLKHYLPKERVFLSGLPTWMRYAGPREAIFHGVVRKNFGCTHFIVGRDHAGVGNFYPPYAAQEIFDKFEVGVEVIPVKAVDFCFLCDSFVTERTCPHPEESREKIAMSRIKQFLQMQEGNVERILRPEIAAYLRQAVQKSKE